MTALFGYSLDAIARLLFVVCGAILAGVLLLGLQRPILLRISLRQLPRRRAQMALIALGLGLGSSIITSVFLTGDTVQTAINVQVVEGLGRIDEILHASNGPYVPGDVDLSNLSGIDTGAPAASIRGVFLDELSGHLTTGQDWQPEVYFPLSVYQSMRAALAHSATIAALIPEVVEHHALLTDATSRQIRGQVKVIGLPGRRPAAFGAILDARGRTVDPARMPPGAAAINEVAASDLGAGVGDRLLLFLNGRRYALRLDAIVTNGGLAGAMPAILLPMPALQRMMHEPGAIDRILAVNRGAGDAAAAALSDQATADLYGAAPFSLSVDEAKATGLREAQQAQEIFSRIFTLFALFAAGVGLLLVFLIFTILAADRRAEMGISRVVGMKRRDLVRIYLYEGTVYAVVSSALGLALGIGIGAAIVNGLNLVLDNYGFTLPFVVHQRVAVISYGLGLLATWVTVVLASWWATRLTVSSAIRDLPEPAELPPGPIRALLRPWRRLWWRFTTEARRHGGYSRYGSRADREHRFAVHYSHQGAHVHHPSDRSRRVSAPGSEERSPSARSTGFDPPSHMRPQSQALAAVVLPLPLWLIRLLRAALASLLGFLFAACVRGPGLLAAGVATVWWSVEQDQTPAFAFGITAAILGAALSLRGLFRLLRLSAATSDRLAFTCGGAALVGYWSLPADAPEYIGLPALSTGIEIFFLAGMAMVLGAVWMAMYNLDGLLRPLGGVLGLPGKITAAVRTAAAYTLHRPARTGVILAMFALVSFTLTVMAVVTDALERTYGDVQAQTGGFDIRGDLLYDDPILSLAKAMRQGHDLDSRAFSFAGSQGYVPIGVVQLSAPRPAWRLAYADVLDGDFLRGDGFTLLSRAAGYATDASVWAALRRHTNLALIGSDMLPGGDATTLLAAGNGAPAPYTLDAATAPGFRPVGVWMADPRGGGAIKLTIIGVVDDGDGRHGGLIVPAAALARGHIPPILPTFFFRVKPGHDVTTEARRIGSHFLEHGMQTTVLVDAVWVQRGPKILLARLLQGFVGLVLLLGIAGLAAAAMRSVVERRQQIGMMRALGMPKRVIRLSFLLESSAVALAGLAIGVSLGILLARNLFLADFFEQYQTGLTMEVPWGQIALVVGLTYLVSMLATLLPAHLAGRVSPVEALMDR